MSTTTTKQDYNALKAMLIAQCLLEQIDELKGTFFYRGTVAGALRHLKNVCNAEYRETIEKLFERDDETALQISQQYDRIFDALPALTFEQLHEIAEIVEQKTEKS